MTSAAPYLFYFFQRIFCDGRQSVACLGIEVFVIEVGVPLRSRLADGTQRYACDVKGGPSIEMVSHGQWHAMMVMALNSTLALSNFRSVSAALLSCPAHGSQCRLEFGNVPAKRRVGEPSVRQSRRLRATGPAPDTIASSSYLFRAPAYLH
jgi:hypothetical protein